MQINTTFYNGNDMIVSKQQMLETIKNYISKYNSEQTQIIVGSDSQYARRAYTFVTVIAIIHKGKGGIYFYTKQKKNPSRKLNNKSSYIAWKVWEEAMLIVNMCSLLTQNGIKSNSITTHHDMSIMGASGQHITGITGMMKSIGFNPQIKPFSYVASGIANRYTK